MDKLLRRPPVFTAALILLLCILSAYSVPQAYAQQTVTSATLSGRVEDTTGAVVRGATVTVVNLGTNQSQTSVTDTEGRYRFSYLTVGDYQLKIEQSGFSTLTRELTLTVACQVKRCGSL